jgi:tetratricopeptide (TPR) repeat protein
VSFDHAVRLDPASEPAWGGRAEALSELGDYSSAAESYARASFLNSGSAAHLTGMGEALIAAGRHAEAALAFDRAAVLSPGDARVWQGRGTALVYTKRFAEAADSFDKVIAIDPGNPAAWNGKGAALFHMKKYGEAVEVYDKAIELAPGNAPAWNNKALALAEMKDFRAAEAAFERAKRIAGWWTEPRIGKVSLYIALGNTANAYEAVGEAISAIGKDAGLLAARGFTELAMREYGSASGSFREAAERDLGNPAHLLWQSYADYLSAELDSGNDGNVYRDRIASVLSTLDKAHRLIEPEERDETLPPWAPHEEKKPGEKDARLMSDILYFKARCYFSLGDYDKTVRTLEECARLDAGDDRDVKRVLKNVWKNYSKPSLWRWWLSQPVNPWPKRILFFSVSLLALGLIVAHPLLVELMKPYTLDTAVYISLVALLIGILFVPLTEKTREEEYVFSLTPDLQRDPVVTTISLDGHIKQIRQNLSV